jgi:hypothetical protein
LGPLFTLKGSFPEADTKRRTFAHFPKRPNQGDAVFQNRSTLFATVAALALFAGACGDDESTSPSGDADNIAQFVASASIDTSEGTLHTGGVPYPTGGGPVIHVDGHLTIVNGGTATLHVSSSDPFSTVYVAGSGPISKLFVTVTGFYQIPLPAPTTAADLLIAFPQALPSSNFDLYVAAADPEGDVGALTPKSFHALFVGTGDVQVTANWNTDADVDLHVIDPSGWEIYWSNRQSPSGGELDLDSNAGCSTDGVRNENITWGVGEAPQGTYTVRLDYWSSCDAPQTDWTVLINNGGNVEIYHGTFYGLGDNGGYGSGILIDTFTRTIGPMPGPMIHGIPPDQPVGPTTKPIANRLAPK